MNIRTLTQGTALAVTALCFSAGVARAELQIKNGDNCYPHTNTTAFARDNGSMRSTSSATQGFICPVNHINAQGWGPYSLVPSQQTGLSVTVFVRVPAGGWANCSPVSHDYNGLTAWGTGKSGTSGFSWSFSELRFSNTLSGLSIFCALTGNGATIDVIHTQR